MKASRSDPSCDQVRLDVLLFGDEGSAEFRDSAGHVESCSRCQERLSKMAGDDGDWAEVRDVLRSREEEVGSAAPAGSLSPAAGASRPIKLDFLAPPSHPEMLGRLGRYEIEQVIGAGGFGIVLKGFDTELNRPVAIKVLAPHLAHRGPARKRFAREARAAAAVVHEHVVAIHNVESEHEVPFLVMQYVPGRSLQDRVEQDGPLATAEILRIGMQAAAGLAAAHAQGVIHRDVKPGNILQENGVERILLTDFGLARAADDASLTHSGIVAGTPHYMSPEQAGGEPTDARSDLFSLGAVLYFMATGHPPFRAERAVAVLNRIRHDRHRSVWEINPSIPDEVADIIDRLLEKKPGRRFANADEVQRALAGALNRIQQPAPWRTRRLVRRLRRRRRQLVIAAGIVLVVASLGSLSSWFHPGGYANKSDETARSSVTPSNAEIAALELSTQPAGFAKQLDVIDRSLRGIEISPHPETLVVRAAGDTWNRELKAADAEVARLEKLWPIDLNESSTLEVDQDLNNLTGMWVATTGGEFRGMQEPKEDIEKAGHRLVISGNKLAWYTLVREAPILEGTIQIDSTADPKTLDLTFVRDGQSIVALCIYELAGDNLKLCYDEGRRPAGFATRHDDLNVKLYVFKRKR